MSTKEHLICVSISPSQLRLDRWLRFYSPCLKQSFIEKILREKLIFVNDMRVKSCYRLKRGDEVKIDVSLVYILCKDFNNDNITLLNPQELKWFKKLILWEDNELLVINKPSNLPVQGGVNINYHLDKILKSYEKLNNNSKYRLVHRIDRDTSGVLLIAKSLQISRNITEQFRIHRVSKVYIALVNGIWPSINLFGVIKKKLSEDSFQKRVVVNPNGKEAETLFKVIRTFNNENRSLLLFIPKTGRKHQIRVHTTYYGYPIVGDKKYNFHLDHNNYSNKEDFFLHAYQISIYRSCKDRLPSIYTAPLPKKFLNYITDEDLEREIFRNKIL